MSTTTKTTSDIHSRAMLIRLSVSCWDGRRFDKKITDEVNTRHAATKEAGRYNKHLLGGRKASPTHMEAVSKGKALRTAFYAQTLPWADEGWRLLPTANYDTFTDSMRKVRASFDAAVDTFILDYPRLKESAKALLNGMYCEDDYPTVDSIRERFRFSIDFAPVPSKGDFCLNLPADQLISIQDSTMERVESATKDAMQEIWKRLHGVVQKVSETLESPKRVFRDTLISNVADMADALTRMNVTNDPTLESMRARVSAEIAELNPDTLRTQPRARKLAVKSADAILETMKGLYGGE